MIVCPLGKPCIYRTKKVRLQPSNICWWWYLGWCSEECEYDGKKPEKVTN